MQRKFRTAFRAALLGRRRRSHGTRGVTMIDAILMMVVMGIGLTGLMSTFESTGKSSMDGMMTVSASFLAQQRIDQVVADKAMLGYNTITNNQYPSPENVAGFGGVTRNTVVLEVNPADLTTALPGSGLKRIDVTTSWGNANTQRVILTTLVTNY